MPKALFVTAAVLALTGCVTVYAGSGDTVTQNRDLPNFDRLESSRGVSVTLACGPVAKAVLHGDADEVANIDLHVEGHTLIVRRNSTFGGYRLPVHIEVTTPQPLDRMEASSGSSVDAPACTVSADRLDLHASSGAELKVAGRTEHLTAEASSGGTITRLNGGRLDARDADLHASSGGSVRVCSVGHLNGHASSGGNISSEESGSGDRSSSSGGDFSTRRCD